MLGEINIIGKHVFLTKYISLQYDVTTWLVGLGV